MKLAITLFALCQRSTKPFIDILHINLESVVYFLAVWKCCRKPLPILAGIISLTHPCQVSKEHLPRLRRNTVGHYCPGWLQVGRHTLAGLVRNTCLGLLRRFGIVPHCPGLAGVWYRTLTS